MIIPSTTPGMLRRARSSSPAISRRLAITGALALALVGVSVPAASAGEDEKILVSGGEVEFDHRGEFLWAIDLRLDGYGVRAYVTWKDGVGGRHKAPATDPDPDPPGQLENLSIPEGTTVWLKVCYTRQSADARCSRQQRAEA
jgi:hypothetical protein